MPLLSEAVSVRGKVAFLWPHRQAAQNEVPNRAGRLWKAPDRLQLVDIGQKCIEFFDFSTTLWFVFALEVAEPLVERWHGDFQR